MVAGRLVIALLLLMSSKRLSAQKNPVVYAGFEAYRHTGFSDNSFGNFSIGSQVYHWKIFAPEIGFDHYRGSLPDRVILEGSPENRVPKASFHQSFYANLLTLNPKIKLGKEGAYISFSPAYHTGNISARGSYYVLSDNRFILEEEQVSSSPISFWSFSVGVEGLAIQTEKYWFSLSLNYTQISVSPAFSLLDFSKYQVKAEEVSTTSIGLGLRFYFNAFPVAND